MTGKQVYVCPECGEEFEKYPSQCQGDLVFCSKSCSATYHGKRRSGDDVGVWKGGPRTLECEHCGDDFDVKPCRADEARFCSTECWYSYMEGENHPRWSENPSVDYGSNWVSARNRVRERDGNVCQRCGATEDEIGRKPDVHHKTPVREFDDPDEAHTMDNMVQLCTPCHRKVEFGYAKVSDDV